MAVVCGRPERIKVFDIDDGEIKWQLKPEKVGFSYVITSRKNLFYHSGQGLGFFSITIFVFFLTLIYVGDLNIYAKSKNLFVKITQLSQKTKDICYSSRDVIIRSASNGRKTFFLFKKLLYLFL